MSLQQVPPGRGDDDARAGETGAGAARPAAAAVTPSPFERGRGEADGSRRTIYIVVALASALLVAGLVWLATRPSTPAEDRRLEGALRSGSPEFEQVRERIVVDFNPDEHATIGERALGDLQVGMKPTVRNFTGRTIGGLEFRAAGLDLGGQAIRERIYVWERELEANRTAEPNISMNFTKDRRPARLRLELTAVRFK